MAATAGIPGGLPPPPRDLGLRLWSSAVPLWLHRSHGSSSSTARPLEVPALKRGVSAARAAVTSAAFAGTTRDQHCGAPCWIEDRSLCAESREGAVVTLAGLFLAEVSCEPLPAPGEGSCPATAPRLSLLAIAPSANDAGLRGTAPGGLDMTGAPVWYVVLEVQDSERAAVLDELSQLGCIRGELERFYTPGDESAFGRGANASVSRMYRRDSGQVVAVKKMNAMMEMDAIERELATLLQVQLHPHVIGCHGVFWNVEEGGPRLSIVLEAALAGDMLNQVLHVGVLTEPKAKPLFAGMMQGLAHLHVQDIVHRDIKAENILLVSEEMGVRAVIADFGLATWLSDSVQMARRCGSPGYVAPEVCVGTPYGLNVDVFGAGVVLFFMLSKEMPFVSKDRDTAATMRKTVKCALHLHRPPFDAMSSRVRGMLRETICKSPADRLSSTGAVLHPWLQGKGSSRPDGEGAQRQADARHALAASSTHAAPGGHGGGGLEFRAPDAQAPAEGAVPASGGDPELHGGGRVDLGFSSGYPKIPEYTGDGASYSWMKQGPAPSSTAGAR